MSLWHRCCDGQSWIFSCRGAACIHLVVSTAIDFSHENTWKRQITKYLISVGDTLEPTQFVDLIYTYLKVYILQDDKKMMLYFLLLYVVYLFILSWIVCGPTLFTFEINGEHKCLDLSGYDSYSSIGSWQILWTFMVQEMNLHTWSGCK